MGKSWLCTLSSRQPSNSPFDKKPVRVYNLNTQLLQDFVACITDGLSYGECSRKAAYGRACARTPIADPALMPVNQDLDFWTR